MSPVAPYPFRLVRDERLANGYDAGRSLADLAAAEGLSVEGVRLALIRCGVTLRSRSAAAAARRARLKREAAQAVVSARLAASGSVAGVAARAGVPVALASEIVRENFPDAERRLLSYAGRTGPGRVPDGTLLAAIGEAARLLGRSPSCDEYAALAREHGWRGPQTAANRFGSWREACRLAGAPRPGSVRVYSRTYAHLDAVAALASCSDEIGHPPSQTEYADWSRGRAGVPSLSVVRKLLGSWASATRVLLTG